MSQNRYPERHNQKKFFLEALKNNKKRISGVVDFLKATGQRIALLNKQILSAYGDNSKVALRGLLVPPEIFYATGFVPFTPEIICGIMASRNQLLVQRMIQKAEEQAYNQRICNFIKITAGSLASGFLPTPSVVVSSPSFCSGMEVTLDKAVEYYKCPYFYLDIPRNNTAVAINYLADQLRNLVAFLCGDKAEIIREVEENKLPKSILLAAEANKYWTEINELRKAIPSPWSAREAFKFASVLSQSWGSQTIVDIYKLLRDEISARVDRKLGAIPNERGRFLALHFAPFYSDKMLSTMENFGAAIVMEEVNFPRRNNMDPNKPYESLARAIIYDGNYRSGIQRGNDLIYLVKEFGINGIIYFEQENCGWNKDTFPLTYDILKKNSNIPILFLGIDALVDSREKILLTRVESFIKSIVPDVNIIRNKNDVRILGENDYVVGIDIGSTTIKVVILNKERSILGSYILPTGSDKKNIELALNKALVGISLIDNIPMSIVITGVGRTNVPTLNPTPVSCDEIKCHYEGARHIFPNIGSIIDIGGQDTKIILGDGTSVMNDVCAAGSGKFLEKIACALKVPMDKLGELDANTTIAEIINRVCAVYAETDVVNLVAQGKPLEAIVRGCHNMIATRTIVLLKRFSPIITPPIVMTGGVALNRGVIRAIEEQIGEKILIPNKISPQLVGALGAAIIALNNVL